MNTPLGLVLIVAGASVAGVLVSRSCRAQEKTQTPLPPASQQVIALFDGQPSDLEKHWVRTNGKPEHTWQVQGGVLRVNGGGDIATREKWKDFQLHLEFRPPLMPPHVKGQKRGNSGVFLQGRYEIQILDSFAVPRPGKGDAGAVYDQAAPLLYAYKPGGEWQTYDIAFRAPRVDATGKVTEPARVTVLLNGFVVQNNQPIAKPTGAATDHKVAEAGHLRLQDHGDAVEFRRIRIVPLPEQGSQKY